MLPPDLVAKLAQCATHDFAGPRDLWFGRLARFTTAVFVGLVLELPELRYELKLIAREWIPYFRYRILSPRERNVQAAKVAAFIGWILIVVGVGGERYAEVKVKDLDASIQECSDVKVAVALLQASEANEKAEYEALSRAEIEAKVAWRSLTPTEKNEIALALRRFGKLAVAVGYEGTDAESSSFASDIVDALAATRTLKVGPEGGMLHIETPTVRKGHIIPGMATGVLVAPTVDTACKSLASAIAKDCRKIARRAGAARKLARRA